MAAPRPYITNMRDSGVLGAVGRACVILPLWALVLVAPVLVLETLADWCARVPRAPDILAHDDVWHDTEIRASSGMPLGGASQGHRPWVAIEEVPPDVVAAFVAAEDEAFFTHHGIDPRGLARAAVANLRARRIVQGGSTITQQVAKMYVGRERTWDRKIREALLARRIERRFTKREILEAYLNRIYLGAGAHGVSAAADRYFARPLDQLDVHEVALLAGLTSAPSRLNPFQNPEGALNRRAYVLRRMTEMGLIDEAARQRADATPLALDRTRPDGAAAPYALAEARRRLRGLETRDAAPARGRIVETTVNLALQQAAVSAVSTGAERVGRHRQDPIRLMRLAPHEWQPFSDDVRARLGDTRDAGQVVAAVVRVVDTHSTRIELESGGVWIALDDDAIGWARKREAKPGTAHRRRKREREPPRPLTEFVAPGDVVQVRLTEPATADGPTVSGELVPVADIQGALVSLERSSGAIRALAGGTGFDVSQFNRATRGCRQPGSAFKPILYAQALRRGLTPASLVHDFPVRYEDHAGRLIWEPRNADRDFEGTLTLASALAHSRNLPAVKLANRLGLRTVASLARRLGIESPLEVTPSLVLGASCTTPLELTAVYSTFARRGEKTNPHLVRAIYTRDGELLYDRGHWTELAGPLDARLHRLVRALKQPPERVLSSRIAYLTTYMLRQVVQGGTAFKARRLGVPSAGKTGTTNRFDVWYVGFTEDVVTGVWLGDDRNTRDLGEGESGGTSALPVWMQFMEQALAGVDQDDPLDGPPNGVEFARIDPVSGKLAHPDGPGRWMPFTEGSKPTETAPGPTERAAQAADQLDREF